MILEPVKLGKYVGRKMPQSGGGEKSRFGVHYPQNKNCPFRAAFGDSAEREMSKRRAQHACSMIARATVTDADRAHRRIQSDRAGHTAAFPFLTTFQEIQT